METGHKFEKELNALILNARDNHFSEQSLVCFDIIDEKIKHGKHDPPELNDVSSIFSSERNFNGFIYMVQALDEKGHLTLQTNNLKHKIYKSKIASVNSNFDDNRTIRYCHVPSDTSYVSNDKGWVVLNDDNHCAKLDDIDTSLYRNPIGDASSMMIDLFELGIHRFFSFDNKKRSTEKVTNKKRGSDGQTKNIKVTGTMYEGKKTSTIYPHAVPTITMGYSTNDANEYKNSHSTVAGTLKPFLRNGKVTRPISKKIIEIVELVLSVLPKEECFNLDLISNTYGERDHRKRLISDLKEFLGGNRDTTNFRVEGIAVIIPLTIGYHVDTLNCSTVGMKSVVSVNAKIPINETTLPVRHTSILRRWLEENGYETSFPCSIILYSRASVGSYTKKLSETERISRTCSLRKTVSWAMINHVDTVVDYMSSIFENDDYVNEFNRVAKTNKDSYFKGKFHKRIASYNRMVSERSNNNIV